jgi:hypothetical protein
MLYGTDLRNIKPLYVNVTPFNQTIYVRVENSNGCASIASSGTKLIITSALKKHLQFV